MSYAVKRSLLAGLVVATALAVASSLRVSSLPSVAPAPLTPRGVENPTFEFGGGARAPGERHDDSRAPADVPAHLPASSPAIESEQDLMERLRAADPATVVTLARQGRRRYRHGSFADERDSREVDALLALGREGDAHYRAQLFVQHHPSSPFASHVSNLMGVHARPPGVFPDPPDESEEN